MTATCNVFLGAVNFHKNNFRRYSQASTCITKLALQINYIPLNSQHTYQPHLTNRTVLEGPVRRINIDADWCSFPCSMVTPIFQSVVSGCDKSFTVSSLSHRFNKVLLCFLLTVLLVCPVRDSGTSVTDCDLSLVTTTVNMN
ncbi:hypothetical protein CBL_11041 [Carabus blaptoides fortunei]